MKKFAIILAVMFLFVAAVGPATAAPIVFRFAGQSPPDHMATKTMNDMAKEIAQKTNGRVEIKVYPANQLGNYSLVMEEMIRGTIDMSLMSIASEFDPRLELVYVNGFISGYEDAKKVFVPGAWLPNKLNELSSALGVKLIGSYIEGIPSKNPSTRRSIRVFSQGSRTWTSTRSERRQWASAPSPSPIQMSTSQCRPASATRLTATR